MYIFIGGINKTENVLRNSVKIRDELQERVNSCEMTLSGFSPSYFDEIKIYEGFPIVSATSTTITLQKDYFVALQNSLFRVGDEVTFAIGLSDEEIGEITTILNDNGNIKLTFSNTFTNTPIAGELAGILKFAGNIIDVGDSNQVILKNLEFNIKALDYTRIFDKELLNDTYSNKDSRYIVNDFCNVTINKNQVIDEFDYENDSEIQTNWIESGDGNNPEVDLNDYMELSSSGVLLWTFSTGTANFTQTLSSKNIEEYTGSSGTPTGGVLGLWYKTNDYTAITSVEVRIGSDSSNYGSTTITPTSNDWVFFDKKMSQLSITGTPDWTAVDYIEIIITQTANSEINIDGIRILEEQFFRHFPYVEESATFVDFRIPRVKPTEIMQRLANELQWYRYIDYNRYIRLFPKETIYAPISISETSNNFTDLNIKYDISRLINKQIIRGGNETSDSTYSQVVEGDGVTREWILKNKFKNLVVKLDDGSSTDTMEGGTTTTSITATAHGLSEGDYIVNRTRSNAVREVLTAPTSDTFTVEAVTGQTSGDSFSLFVSQNVGIEGLGVEADNDFMSNFNEKSIRNSEVEDTLISGEFLLFTYNEVIPVLVSRTNQTSVNNIVDILGYSNGVFEGQPITDRTLETRSEAVKLAEGILEKYSNVIITASFSTNQEGLKAGQLINIKDTESSERNINQDFIIQNVMMNQIAWGENKYRVTCGSSLYGYLELFQQLLAGNRKIKVDSDEIINNIEEVSETMNITDNADTTLETGPYERGAGGDPQLIWSLGTWA